MRTGKVMCQSGGLTVCWRDWGGGGVEGGWGEWVGWF